MNQPKANIALIEDDIPPSLRPFIDALLERDCAGYSSGTRPHLEERESDRARTAPMN